MWGCLIYGVFYGLVLSFFIASPPMAVSCTGRILVLLVIVWWVLLHAAYTIEAAAMYSINSFFMMRIY